MIRGRYERGATIITSDRDEDELGTLFGDLASAAMDSAPPSRARRDRDDRGTQFPQPRTRRSRGKKKNGKETRSSLSTKTVAITLVVPGPHPVRARSRVHVDDNGRSLWPSRGRSESPSFHTHHARIAAVRSEADPDLPIAL